MLKNKLVLISIIIFLGLSGWWVYLWANGLQGTDVSQAELFGASYGLMALFGGVVGLFVSKKWGGSKSLVGKAIGLFALGLLAQEFGQITYSYLGHFSEGDPAYPSIGDIGFFGSIIFYVLGLLYLIKALKVKGSLGSIAHKLFIVLLPLALLAGSYMIFLRGYEADPANKLATISDFSYPLGQAFYFALAILAYILSRKYLGGIMKFVILFLIAALLTQYLADFTFLYSINNETWQTAGTNDLTYLTAYFIMTLALIRFGIVVDNLRSKNSSNDKPEDDDTDADSEPSSVSSDNSEGVKV